MHSRSVEPRDKWSDVERGAGKASGRQNLGDCGARGRGRRHGPRALPDTYSLAPSLERQQGFSPFASPVLRITPEPTSHLPV